jgi:hypothetical protein
MDPDKKVKDNEQDLFERYGEDINRAYERAVREALRKHKLAGNAVAISRDGKVILLQPDEIEVD